VSSYFRIDSSIGPWGDYGSILINGLADTTYDGGKLKRICLSRTGPFVPPLTQPWGQIIVVDDLRRELEESGFSGFEFLEVELTKLVRCDWHNWDQNADEPHRYPAGGEPENYILRRLHNTRLAKDVPPLWALNVEATEHLQVEGSTTFYLGRHPGTDIARAFYVFWVSEPLKVWLEERVGRWIEFTPVVPR
jgi:hypothetical protein